MTRVSCRQRQCTNWEHGGCTADEIAIDHQGMCGSQDDGESLAAVSDADWEIEEDFDIQLDDEEEEDDDWEADGWLDEEEMDDEDDLDEDDEGDDLDDDVATGRRRL